MLPEPHFALNHLMPLTAVNTDAILITCVSVINCFQAFTTSQPPETAADLHNIIGIRVAGDVVHRQQLGLRGRERSGICRGGFCASADPQSSALPQAVLSAPASLLSQTA